MGDDGFQKMFGYELALNTLELKEDNGSENVIGWNWKWVYISKLGP